MRRPRVVVLRGHSANPWELGAWELLADRFDVTVLVTGRNLYDVSSLDLHLRPVRTARDVLPRGRLGDVAVRARGDRYLNLEEHLRGADVVHSAELEVWFAAQPAALKERLGFRLVLTAWETIPGRTSYRSFRGRRHRESTLLAADLFLAATERAKSCLLLEGAPPERIEVCPPGIDRQRFGRRRPREADLVVSPGRLVWEKGHQDVLRALAALDQGLAGETRRFRALLVGSGPEKSRLRAYARELGLAGRIEIGALPYDRMPDAFARAGCVVLASLPTPTWEEQFGMVLMEAMAAGAPIVATTCGAIPEVVGPDAKLVAPGDWLALARALAHPPAGSYESEQLERYSMHAAATRLSAAYERVLGSR